MTDELLRELDALAREDDRQRIERIEHALWWAERRPPVTESGDADVIHHSQPANAPAALAEADDGFSDRQADAVAECIHQLRKEFAADIERAKQQILDVIVRAALPGELAEQGLYDLRNRVALAEQRIERRIAAAMDDGDNVLDLPSFIRRRDAA
jgi:hypothetical protein